MHCKDNIFPIFLQILFAIIFRKFLSLQKYIKMQMSESNQDIFDKIEEAENLEVPFFVAFEPFSFIILQELRKLKTRKEKNYLYESIFRDSRTTLLYKSSTAQTVIFENHNTHDEFWEETKRMAFALNDNEIDVCFLPEIGDNEKSIKRADAIVKMNNTWSIADFKYFVSTNDNTLSKDLERGFAQAKIIVLQLVNADLGIFREAIEYLKRNKKKIDDIIVINEYHRIRYISRSNLLNDKYLSQLKGFL